MEGPRLKACNKKESKCARVMKLEQFTSFYEFVTKRFNLGVSAKVRAANSNFNLVSAA